MRYNLPDIPPPQLIRGLRRYDLLPAIVFVPSRRRCDEAATSVALDRNSNPDFGNKEARQQMFDEFAAEHPEIKRHKHKKVIINSGIASHHAGHIPSWKLLVEKMMSSGLLNAIFATSTVAAGVDFPARTVVILNPETRGNEGWRSLTASELQQMTGRAGRRGRDNVGFAVAAPSRFQDPRKLAELLGNPPDALESKFRSTYTNLLNLLDAFGNFEQVRAIAEKSFAFRRTGKRINRLNRKIGKRKDEITQRLEETTFSLDDALGFERLQSAKNHLLGKIPLNREQIRLRWLKRNVRTGRIVAKGKKGRSFLLVIDVNHDRVTAMKENGQGLTFPIDRIKRIYEKQYAIESESIDDGFYDIVEGRNELIREPDYRFEREDVESPTELIDELATVVLNGEEDVPLWESMNDCGYVFDTERDISYLREEIWEPFLNRARVLEAFGYLEGQTVTDEGKWLADLRLDRPLIVGEALRMGVFAVDDQRLIAGFMAALAADAERDYGAVKPSPEMYDILDEFDPVIQTVCDVELKNGVEYLEEVNYSAAGTAELWFQGVSWNELVNRTGAEEGDLVRLISRTGEALRQIAHLKEDNEESAKNARDVADILLREPIR